MSFLDIFLLVLTPSIELRGAIPYGIAIGMNPWEVILFATVVNILLIFPLFVFLDYLFPFFEDWKITKKLVNRVRKKAKPYVDKYGWLGLALFVAIPLPGSGAYSGALAAYLFGIPKKVSFPAISAGVIIAGLVVSAVSAGLLL